MSWANQQGFESVEGLSTGLQWAVDNAGKVACKTEFKSRVKIVDASDKDLKIDTQNGNFMWMEVPEGSSIYYEVETLADKKKGASDRVTLEITYMDTSYLGRMINLALEELDEDSLVKVLTGDTEPITTWLESNPDLVDPSLLMATIYSETITTNEEGKASGIIPIDKSWPLSNYTLNFHYGYSALAEQSTGEKTSRLWIDDIGPIVAELLLTAAIGVISGGAALGIKAAQALKAGQTVARINKARRIAEVVGLIQLAKQYFKQGFGIVGLNKYDCSFPLLGFNHTYGFDNNFETALYDESGNLDFSTIDENKLEALIKKNLARNLAIGVIFTGLLIAGLRRK